MDSSNTRAAASLPGLIQQGWKDSWDSVFHADGTLAEPPIALCEIQGYAYAAWTGAARVAAARGDAAQARRWEDQATALQTQVRARVPCAIGATTSRIGSFAKSGVPSGTA